MREQLNVPLDRDSCWTNWTQVRTLKIILTKNVSILVSEKNSSMTGFFSYCVSYWHWHFSTTIRELGLPSLVPKDSTFLTTCRLSRSLTLPKTTCPPSNLQKKIDGTFVNALTKPLTCYATISGSFHCLARCLVTREFWPSWWRTAIRCCSCRCWPSRWRTSCASAGSSRPRKSCRRCWKTEDNLLVLKSSPWGGPHNTMDSVLPMHPAALGLILGIPKKYSLDVSEIYWQHFTA